MFPTQQLRYKHSPIFNVFSPNCMIFQSLLAASVAASTVKAVDHSPYYPVSGHFAQSDEVRLIEIRGYKFALSMMYKSSNPSFNEVRFEISNPQSGPMFFKYRASEGGSSFTTTASHAAVADFSVPMKTPPTLFAGLQSDLNAGHVRIHQGIKRTSRSTWSQVQILTPPEEFNFQSFYAQSMAADQRTHTLLAVGCPGCNATAEGGQVYLYSPNPGGSYWSQSQVLQLSSSATHAGYHRLGSDVQLHDNVLLASVYVPNSIPKHGYVVYSRGSGPKDSSFEPQQMLTMKFGNVTGAAVYEETIVLSNYAAGSGSFSNVGEVHILYPSTAEFGLKPAAKPNPRQWSVQQIIRPTSREDDLLFGTSIAIDRNHLLVSSVGTSSDTFLFRREEQSGKWSQQQVLTSSFTPTGVSIAGGALALSYTSSSPAAKIFSNQGNWDCLMIYLEDHFGDGWDTAEFIVATPDGTHDYFSPACDDVNPLQLRYCPAHSDGGLYSFSIPEAIKAKHYWEIQWSIFDEKTALWYRGKWDTKMDFHWDPDTLSFSPRKIERPLANSTVCEYCPSRPTEKPTPVLGRHLKGSDDSTRTRSPTVSPAPTLATTNSENWRYLTLYGDSHPWFDNQYQGTNYYVTDARGHRLIATGTACTSGIDQKCWLDLPDGDYILRLGGALDLHSSDHTFSFCKTVNEKSVLSQMMFRIKDNDCSVVTFASRQAVCESYGYGPDDVLTLSVVLNVNILLHGTSISTATSAEQTVFQTAMASLFKGLTPADVSLVSVTPSGDDTYVAANLRMSAAAMGFNILDYDQENAFEAYLKDSFSSHAVASSLGVALASGSVASAFARVTGVEFLDYQLVDSIEVVTSTSYSSESELVTSYADLPTSSFIEKETEASTSPTATHLVESLSLGGYFFAFVGILFAFIALLRNQKNPAVDREIAPPTETPKSLPRTLSPNDLQELAQMESDYLKIASSHGVGA
jgi:hypothetical protein